MVIDEAQDTKPAAPEAGQTREVTLPISGMTCASCVRRVERALTRTPGVHEATVNLATERAQVAFDPSVIGLESLGAAVEKAGYAVALPEPPAVTPAADAPDEPVDGHAVQRAREIDDLKRKALTSLVAGAAMMALMYLPLGLDMTLLAPVLLIAATVVQFWAGRGFYQAAWAAARHGTTNMNTLVAVGTSLAYGYSAFVTLWPASGRTLGLPRPPLLRDGGHHHRPDPAGPLARGAGQEARPAPRSRR